MDNTIISFLLAQWLFNLAVIFAVITLFKKNDFLLDSVSSLIEVVSFLIDELTKLKKTKGE